MGIRETLNANQKLTTVLTAVVLVGLVGYIAWYVSGMTSNSPQIGKAYFTTDEGATLLVEDENRRAPFQHEGKEAVRAYVYECDGEQFVAYLERYSPEAMAAFAEYDAEAASRPRGSGPPPSMGKAQSMTRSGLQVKRPGGDEWISATSPEGTDIKRNVKCPDGTGGVPQPVMP